MLANVALQQLILIRFDQMHFVRNQCHCFPFIEAYNFHDNLAASKVVSIDMPFAIAVD